MIKETMRLLGSAFFISTVLSITGCSNFEAEKPKNNNSSEYDELFLSLNQYSCVYIKTHPASKTGSRGWKEFWKAVGADFGGYSQNGDALVSISASRKRWKEEKLKKKLDQLDETPILTPSEQRSIAANIDSLKTVYFTDKSNIGALHNAAILQAILDDDMSFNSTEDLVKSTLICMEKVGFDISKILVSDTSVS